MGEDQTGQLEGEGKAAKEAAKTAERRTRDLPAAAQRALKEAEERRRRSGNAGAPQAREVGGPKGEEPTRFGDWERGGRAIDF